VEPYAVHATYTFDGATAVAKQFRFRELGLWIESDDYYEKELFLTWDPTPPEGLRGPVGLTTHLKVCTD
jgi:hypothetical protein